MNFYKSKREKTTLSPLEVVQEMKELNPKVNSNLDLRRYLQCEKGYRTMKGEMLNNFLEVIEKHKENEVKRIFEKVNVNEWFEDFKEHFTDKMLEFNISSQKELGKLIDIPQSEISKTLNGKRDDETIKAKIKAFFDDDMNIQIKKNENSKKVNSCISNQISDIYCDKLIQYKNETGKKCIVIAKELGMDSGSVSRILRRKYNFSINSLNKVKNYLGETDNNFDTPKKEKSKYSSEEEMKKIKEKITNHLTATGKSGLALAKEIGIDKSIISKILSGNYSCGEAVFKKINDFFNELGETTISEPDFEEKEQDSNIEVENNSSKTEEQSAETNEMPKGKKEDTTAKVEYDFQCYFNHIIKENIKLIKKTNRQKQIIENYETLIKIIKTLQD